MTATDTNKSKSNKAGLNGDVDVEAEGVGGSLVGVGMRRRIGWDNHDDDARYMIAARLTHN